MLRFFLMVLATLSMSLAALPRATSAQTAGPDDVVWVQIEAQQSLARATDRARAYATLLQDVNGFAVGGGWYAVVVGPYRRADAELVLQQYRDQGLIPVDSFIQLSSRLQQQFWPVGANVLGAGVANAPETLQEQPAPAQNDDAPLVADVLPQPADETPAQAQRSERSLSREEREELQIMLQWAGFYNAAIDGAFGRGTRNSMAAWQESNGQEVTGILTTGQRAMLKKQYNAILDGMGLKEIRDTTAGIAMTLPTGVVDFDRYEPPFAHYEPTGTVQARVLLISQPGDQATLFGLYEIMQTLEIVPLEGPRERRPGSFTLTGENTRLVSHTEAALEDGEIKGFTLIWPAGDEERRQRILSEMRASFTRLPGVLSASAGDGVRQSVDLVAGLQVRKPILSRSGFFLTDTGTVATTSEVVGRCGRLTLDGDTEAEVIANDAASGVALIRPLAALAPLAVAQLSAAEPRLQSEVALAGYSFEGVLGAPSMTFGTLADVRGLRGEENLRRLALSARPGDAGGPVLGEDGGVIGMLAPTSQNGQQLPEDVSFALDAATLAAVSAEAGIALPRNAAAADALTPFQIAKRATGMTVLVSCWE